MVKKAELLGYIGEAGGLRSHRIFKDINDETVKGDVNIKCIKSEIVVNDSIDEEKEKGEIVNVLDFNESDQIDKIKSKSISTMSFGNDENMSTRTDSNETCEQRSEQCTVGCGCENGFDDDRPTGIVDEN
ncbi:6813_t:CDS:2 [Racocetra fulgida]|uniref:6813_t:CDS:1 n=1 Tax=Racocetra fulgida TaxID=60492 RepID=A0A9N9D4S1_9GLOM|nr:6813_t:CDS:2 [Racocetra fulgida]